MAIDRISNPAQVANLYANNANAAARATADDAATSGVSFGDMIRSGIEGAVSSVKAGEQASASAVVGKADLNDVVQSITKAEMTLQTIVAVRDRLVTAYQEILRMPI